MMNFKTAAEQDKTVELSKVTEDLLSTEQAFKQSKCVFLDTPRRKVFRHGNIVIKFGLDVDSSEARTLRFVAETTNIPVPRLYGDHLHSDGTTIIAMEFVEGRILSELWPDLRHEEKMRIVGQLHEILKEMRRHRNDTIGGILNTPAVDTRMLSYKGGPFQSEDQFNKFLRSDMIAQAPKMYRTMLEGSMQNTHDIVLTHSDISPRNIIVHDCQIKAVIDWEYAGWYPEYWDFVKFFNALDPSLDWSDYASEIFPEIYPRQFLTDRFLGLYLAH